MYHWKELEYNSWRGMNKRCYQASDISYGRYGGRGVTVCERWRNDYFAFLSDMGRRPTAKHSLDRFPDPHGNYEPGNCRWATSQEQSRNRRNSKRVTLDGATKTVAEWSDVLGISDMTFYSRLRQGWSPERTLREATNSAMSSVTYRGKTQNLHAWSRDLRVGYTTLLQRIALGWSIEQAFTKPVRIIQPKTRARMSTYMGRKRICAKPSKTVLDSARI